MGFKTLLPAQLLRVRIHVGRDGDAPVLSSFRERGVLGSVRTKRATNLMDERNSPGPQSGQTKYKLDGWQKPPKGKRRLGFWHGEYMSLADTDTLWAGPIGVGQTEQDW